MANDEFFEDEIDWKSLLTELTDPSMAEIFSNRPPDGSVSSWIGDIESMLMNDNDDNSELKPNQQSLDDFFADVFVDQPSPSSGAEVIELPTDKDQNSSDESGNAGPAEEKVLDEPEANDSNKNFNEADSDNADDPISKKRRRQLRNRDAAVKSRERKKMYVQDLEMKSRYLESECRKLGRLLHCVLAENQALRFSLQKGNAYGASLTKQESAVLLLGMIHELSFPHIVSPWDVELFIVKLNSPSIQRQCGIFFNALNFGSFKILYRVEANAIMSVCIQICYSSCNQRFSILTVASIFLCSEVLLKNFVSVSLLLCMFIKSVGRIFLGMRVLTCVKFCAFVVVGKQGSESIVLKLSRAFYCIVFTLDLQDTCRGYAWVFDSR